MDSIDITSPEFSLGNITEINHVVSDAISLGDNLSDYTMYIYLGIFILLLIIVSFVYKVYFHREKKVTFQDNLDECYGGICPR